MTTEAESVCSIGAVLGESPVWIGREEALWFVDMKGRVFHRYTPADGALKSWSAPSQACWILPDDDGGHVVGLQHGIHRFDPGTGGFTPLQEVERPTSALRLNDAATAPSGAIWFGTMDDDEETKAGRIYRLSGGTVADGGLDPVVVTNGPAISPDGRTLYPVDTRNRTIWAVPIHDDGTLGERRILAHVEGTAGHPDGSRIDAEGHVWVGLYGGWGVRRYTPDGRLAAHIPLPVANVTKIAFGGEGLSTAYATTARRGLSTAALSEQPLAGDLFAFEPGVAGLPCPLARIG